MTTSIHYSEKNGIPTWYHCDVCDEVASWHSSIFNVSFCDECKPIHVILCSCCENETMVDSCYNCEMCDCCMCETCWYDENQTCVECQFKNN